MTDYSKEFGHEKLRVYREAVSFIAFAENLITNADRKAAVIDQLSRAAESIVYNIADGNSRWSEQDRTKYFDYSYGSALESAACLDISLIKGFTISEEVESGKDILVGIVKMLFGLRKSYGSELQEDSEEYGSGSNATSINRVFFNHERLDVYKLGLEFIRWVHECAQNDISDPRCTSRMDAYSTTIVLNIAESNGRFAVLDQNRFLETSYRAALKAAATLDVAASRRKGLREVLDVGKRILRRIGAMIMAMRG